MGAQSCEAIKAAEGLELVAEIDMGDDLAAGLAQADVALESKCKIGVVSSQTMNYDPNLRSRNPMRDGLPDS